MTDSPVPSERATREAEKLWRGKDAPLTFHKLALALDRFAEEARAEAADKNVAEAMALLAERSAMGLVKYGCATSDAGLDDLGWLRHLRDELLDGAVYATAAIRSRSKPAGAGGEE